MCFSSSVKKPPPAPAPPSEASLSSRRNQTAELQAKQGILSTQTTGAYGLLTEAPGNPKTLLGT